jgi:hypothetical protein
MSKDTKTKKKVKFYDNEVEVDENDNETSPASYKMEGREDENNIFRDHNQVYSVFENNSSIDYLHRASIPILNDILASLRKDSPRNLVNLKKKYAGAREINDSHPRPSFEQLLEWTNISQELKNKIEDLKVKIDSAEEEFLQDNKDNKDKARDERAKKEGVLEEEKNNIILSLNKDPRWIDHVKEEVVYCKVDVDIHKNDSIETIEKINTIKQEILDAKAKAINSGLANSTKENKLLDKQKISDRRKTIKNIISPIILSNEWDNLSNEEKSAMILNQDLHDLITKAYEDVQKLDGKKEDLIDHVVNKIFEQEQTTGRKLHDPIERKVKTEELIEAAIRANVCNNLLTIHTELLELEEKNASSTEYNIDKTELENIYKKYARVIGYDEVIDKDNTKLKGSMDYSNKVFEEKAADLKENYLAANDISLNETFNLPTKDFRTNLAILKAIKQSNDNDLRKIERSRKNINKLENKQIKDDTKINPRKQDNAALEEFQVNEQIKTKKTKDDTEINLRKQDKNRFNITGSNYKNTLRKTDIEELNDLSKLPTRLQENIKKNLKESQLKNEQIKAKAEDDTKINPRKQDTIEKQGFKESALSQEELSQTLRLTLVGSAGKPEDAKANISKISALMDSQQVPSADILRQILDEKVQDDYGDGFSPRVLLMASLVPHVLDALIENSAGEQKDKYAQLKEQEGVIQTAVLYLSSQDLTYDMALQINALFHLDDEENPLAQTLRMCQKIHDNAVSNSSDPKEVSKLMDVERSLELIDYGKTFYLKGSGKEGPNQYLEKIKNAEIELDEKKTLKREEAEKFKQIDQKIIKEQGFNTKTLAAAFDGKFGDDKFEIKNDDTKKLSDSFKESARVVANVSHVIKALKANGSNVSNLNVGQIQLAAMFLSGVASDSFKSDSFKDDNMDKSIEEFEEFAKANKQEYGFDDEGIRKLTDAMCKFQDACTEGPDKLEENSLAKAFYVSHQLDLPGRKEQGKPNITDEVKQNIEKVVGQEQCSLLMNRSEVVISKTNQKFSSSEELCWTINNAYQEALKKEAEDLKLAMKDTIEKFKQKKGYKKLQKSSEQARLDGMKKAYDKLNSVNKLNSVDRKILDNAKNLFIENAKQHTGWGISKETATYKKFNQKLNSLQK